MFIRPCSLFLSPYFSAIDLKDANMPGTDKAWWRGTILLYASQSNPTKLIFEALRQDAPDLAYDCWQETRYGLDDQLEADLKALVPTLRSRRYRKLEDLLQSGQWKEADKETYRLMITTVGKEDGQGFSRQNLEKFPCEDLLTIDRLWVDASNGHFGFSVQKEIWKKCGSPMDYNDNYRKFMEEVGWQLRGSFVDYSDLKFSTSNSLKGELPGGGRVTASAIVVSTLVGDFTYRGEFGLFSRAETCEL
jgi:hypothetical protein